MKEIKNTELRHIKVELEEKMKDGVPLEMICSKMGHSSTEILTCCYVSANTDIEMLPEKKKKQ